MNLMTTGWCLEKPFLNSLRQHVTIHYSCRGVQVKPNESTSTTNSKRRQYYVTTTSSSHNKPESTTTQCQYGPFDLVVVADGLVFGDSFDNLSGMVVIGDAQRQYDTWWLDFGRRQIQRGGDIAICNALELDQRLVDHLQDPLLFDDDDTFSYERRQSQQRRRYRLRGIVVPIGLAILLSRIRMFNKI